VYLAPLGLNAGRKAIVSQPGRLNYDLRGVSKTQVWGGQMIYTDRMNENMKARAPCQECKIGVIHLYHSTNIPEPDGRTPAENQIAV